MKWTKRITFRSGTCSTPLHLTASQLISSGTFPLPVVNGLLYPGVTVNGLVNNFSVPRWDDLLTIYNLTDVKEASPVPDLQRLEIRDTSVLVRLRPAWEDIRSYLTARGRKRFEVYVCTMAEIDYALEMWRLLDPESNLINPKELLDCDVCVKSAKLFVLALYVWLEVLNMVFVVVNHPVVDVELLGFRKSLFNVFQDRNCHPKMALVID